MKVCAFLPAKGSSNRIQNKNVKLMDGKPLFLHSLEKLLTVSGIDEVYLDSESSQIIELAAGVDCKILKRDPLLASNSTDGNKLLINEASHVKADIYVQLLSTSPFIKPETIDKAISILKETEYDSVVLVKRNKFYSWSESGPNYDINNIPNSNTLADSIIETMGLYVIKSDALWETQRRIGNNPYLLEAEAIEAIDVNYPEDFELADLVAAGKREKDQIFIRNARNLLSSPLLSDILDDLGFPNQIVRGLKPGLVPSKLLGRAKTLKLRALEPEEDYKGIYKALGSYASIIPGDVIVVENAVGEYAYFGELNANLAIRAGAIGAIIAGMTRDADGVARLDFPVYSSGTTCQDVRKRATVDSINKDIVLFGVTCPPGALVFADKEGVVIIPREVEDVVMSEVYKRLSNESAIINDIALGVDVERLNDKYGFF